MITSGIALGHLYGRAQAGLSAPRGLAAAVRLNLTNFVGHTIWVKPRRSALSMSLPGSNGRNDTTADAMIFKTIVSDIDSMMARDPAARSRI